MVVRNTTDWITWAVAEPGRRRYGPGHPASTNTPCRLGRRFFYLWFAGSPPWRRQIREKEKNLEKKKTCRRRRQFCLPAAADPFKETPLYVVFGAGLFATVAVTSDRTPL